MLPSILYAGKAFQKDEFYVKCGYFSFDETNFKRIKHFLLSLGISHNYYFAPKQNKFLKVTLLQIFTFRFNSQFIQRLHEQTKKWTGHYPIVGKGTLTNDKGLAALHTFIIELLVRVTFCNNNGLRNPDECIHITNLYDLPVVVNRF